MSEWEDGFETANSMSQKLIDKEIRKAFEGGYRYGYDHGGHRWGNVDIAWDEFQKEQTVRR